ncbi:NAD(P)/FAD-dependent oxidoreductase [Actinacidiphila glaucinigra]|uniref:phytoene desaturase family protein n=1 Tax=Actinacidiphila glaucinigra TaxID=235986 RepID=UPI0038698978
MARIAVIGAGMGAMAAAARLAIGGHRVAVYERAATHGGAVRRLERAGFGFDTGPALLHLPAVYRDLFVKTGRESLEDSVTLTQVDPASRHVFSDGTSVSLPNASRGGVVAALDAALGAGAGERWSELLVRAREVWDATRRPLLEDALAGDPSALGRDPYPAPAVRRGLFRRGAPALADVARRELDDPRLAALLGSYALAYGFDPRTAPASAAVLPYMEQTFGSWYVRGGMRALADAVHARCVARRVEFHFGTAVTGIVEKDGRAAGLELADDTRVEADTVVAGVAPWLLPPLLSHGAGGAWPADRVWDGVGPGRRCEGPGRLTVCLALRGARPPDTAHRTVVHTADPRAEAAAVARGELYDSPTVTVLRPDDDTLRPDGASESVTLGVTVPPHGPSGVDWRAPGLAERAADAVQAVAAAVLPDLTDRLLWRAVHTPADTEEETGTPGGRLPRPALAGADGAHLHPGNRLLVPGLYLVGGWSHPGGGLAHTGMSGAIAADLVMGGPGGSR